MPRAQISGNQIKDESVETQDIKNGTILLEDLSQEVLDLLGLNSGDPIDTLAELLDVLIPSPQDGEALTFNATSGKWEGVTGTPPAQGSGIVNQFIYHDTAAGDITYQLPDAVSEDGNMYIVKKFDHRNKLIITTFGSQLIDDNTSYTLREYESLTLKSYNGNWYIV